MKGRIMRAGFGAAFLILLLALAPPARAETVPVAAQYFVVVPDLPVMPGLVELPDQGTTFDKPEGRIAETVAAIATGTPQAVETYYDSVLPQLGWKAAGAGQYLRGEEVLKLGFETNEGQSFLRIMVAPRETPVP